MIVYRLSNNAFFKRLKVPLSSPLAISQTPRRALLSMSAFTVLMLAALVAAQSVRAQTYTVVHSFCSQPSCADGYSPDTSLIQASDGNLYGTTEGVDIPREAYRGAGSVFRLTLGGTLTTVYKFCSEQRFPNCPDGAFPGGALIQATNGNLYGTTGAGGPKDAGTIFSLTPAGNLTTLYNFCSQPGCKDGEYPSGLIQAANGNFYGLAGGGGYNHYGTLFSLTPGGSETTLHLFGTPCCGDGAYPTGPLIQATNGNLYGTATDGGTGDGTVFQIAGGKVSTLYNFCADACAGGGVAEPIGGVIQASDGNLYGATDQYATSIFKLTTSGTETTLYSFCNDGQACYTTNGQSPTGPLLQATDGNFYGTTGAGGASNYGTIFKLTPEGVLTTLHSFCASNVPTACADGSESFAGLIQATDGNLYGTTVSGGQCGTAFPSTKGCGTVFRLDVGLGPFVAPQTKFGTVGSTVTILGTNLAGASKVTFNGTPATFSVNSTASAITASVPAGATTGPIVVLLPNGMLQSNVTYTIN